MLPITPESYEVTTGINIQTVSVVGVGDVAVAGDETTNSVTLRSFFPAQRYSFAQTAWTDPQALVTQIESWCAEKTVVRLIVSGTKVNRPMIIESIAYGEQDGSNDIEYTITLQKYTYLSAPSLSDDAAGLTRAEEAPPEVQDTHTVVKGDTLWALARKYYGDGQLAYKLATANSVKNPNLIYPGQVLTLPDKDTLQNYAATR